MLSKRLISCLDVRNGKLAKSVKFVDTKDIGDPVITAKKYYEDGIDELVFYDITASSENRNIMLDVVSKVASQIFIPFSVGGGLRTVEDCSKVLLAGAEKINVNTSAVANPEIISEASRAFGAQCVVLSMDVLRTLQTRDVPSGYEIVTHGGRNRTNMDAIKWAAKGESLGAGELVVNSIDADGTKEGYEVKLTRMIADAVGIPVIASGGGGKPEHILEILTEGHADAALVASMLHFGTYTVAGIKDFLLKNGITMRTTY
jgi:imidazole glycerol-phosphate synthase subunit HisF